MGGIQNIQDYRIKEARLASNHTINNSVVLESTTLTLPVTSGHAYQVHIQLRGISPAAADWRFKLTAPALTEGTLQFINSDSLASIGSDTEYTPNATGSAEVITIAGVLYPVASGDCTFQFAQSNAVVGDTILYRGTSMVFIECQ